MILAFSIGYAAEVSAIRAYPRPVTVRQPDGTTITVRIFGDESFHYVTSVDGYMLAKDKEGFFCYVNYNASTGRKSVTSLRAHDVARRTDAEKKQMKSLEPASAINAAILSEKPITVKAPKQILGKNVLLPQKAVRNGKMNGNESKYLVILVNFQDSVFHYGKEDFDTWLNEPGYSTNGGTGSVKDYYRDNSMGAFVPDFHVVGPYTLSHELAYYGGNDDNDEDRNPREMVSEACRLAKADNPDLNFSQFDNDGDGYMDNCYIIYAGYSEASTANDNDIWPHSWTMGDEQFGIDGITINNYSCSAELVGAPGSYSKPAMDGIGTFTHEFGHILGLKDMYDTDSYTNGYGVDPGDYSLYASGSYNNDSRTPPYLMAFERMQLGWASEGTDITELKDAEDVTLEGLSTNKARYINAQPGRAAGTGYEWFGLENRQKTGWDKYIPAHGLLIYHYDYTSEMQKLYWDVNGPNNNAKHRCLYIKAADGIDDANTRSGDTYPGTSANTAFTDTTTPNSLNWNGDPVGVPVTSITEKDGVILFQVNGGVSKWDVIKTEVPDDVRDVSATFKAEITSHTQDVMEAGFCWDTDSDPTIDDAYNVATVTDGHAELKVDGLEPGSNYNVKAYMKLADGSIVYGSSVMFSTECELSTAPFHTDFTSWTNGSPDCWQIVDHNGDGSTWILDESTDGMVYQFNYWNDADDWLICKRRIHVPEHGTLFFTRGVSGTTTVENLDIYVSTTTSKIDDFFLLDRKSFADYFDELHIEEVDLSRFAGQDIYVAFKCSSEKLQNNLWLFDMYVMDKLGTPEVTTFDMPVEDQLRVEWTPVDKAKTYYLYFGKETDEDNDVVEFAPMSFFEEVKGDVSLSVGSIFFKSSGSVTSSEIPQGISDCKFLVTTSGPVGSSELTVEGSVDGSTWNIIGPRIKLEEFDSEGQECYLETYLKGKGYKRLRFNFTNGGRNGRIKYLTLGYKDGKIIEDLAAGYVNGTSATMDARTPGEFDTGKYAVWVAAGDGMLFYDESDLKYWSKKEASSVEDVIESTNIRIVTSDGKIRVGGLLPGSKAEFVLINGISLYSGVADGDFVEICTAGNKGVGILTITGSDGNVYSTKILLK